MTTNNINIPTFLITFKFLYEYIKPILEILWGLIIMLTLFAIYTKIELKK